MSKITRRPLLHLPAYVLRAVFIGLLVTLVACTPGGPSDGGADATDGGAAPTSTVESTDAPTAPPPQPGATDDYDY